MVIGIEGNVHVGKTTYINKNFSNFKIITEIEFEQDLNDYERQLYYIREEIKKKKEMQTNSNIVLDRTILSTIIYTIYTDSLNFREKNKIISIIKKIIKQNKIIIPEYIYLIIYPYKLISLNHMRLNKKKGTQNSLVDYNYYLNYSLFFSNYQYKYENISNLGEYRQIVIYNSDIFNDMLKPKKTISKILIDGYPKINKISSIYQEKHVSKRERLGINNSLEQINLILEKIYMISKEGKLLENSFLMGISNLFYNNMRTSKKNKLEIIDKIMNSIPLNIYITKIYYFILNEGENEEKNIKDYLKKEKNFYKVLNRRLGEMSNINFIETCSSIDVIMDIIEKSTDKPLMLIDLFFEIKEGIKEGEL